MFCLTFTGYYGYIWQLSTNVYIKLHENKISNHSLLVFAPKFSLHIYIFQTRGTSRNISCGSHESCQAGSTCVCPRWCCMNTRGSRLASSRSDPSQPHSPLQSPTLSHTSLCICLLWNSRIHIWSLRLIHVRSGGFGWEDLWESWPEIGKWHL